MEDQKNGNRSFLWYHEGDGKPSLKYWSPDKMFSHDDRYFGDAVMSIKHEGLFFRSVGYRVCSPSYKFTDRIFDRHALHWILDGEGWCNGVPFAAGDILFLHNQMTQNFSANPENPCTYAWVTVAGEIGDLYLKQMDLDSKFRIYRSEHLTECCALIYDMLYNPLPEATPTIGTQLYFDSALLRLLSLSIPKVEPDEASESGLDSRIKLAKRYIDKTYHDSGLRVHHIADAAGVSEKYFRTLFKQEMGVSVMDFLIGTRLDAAKHLLRASNYTVAEIAEMVGYTDYRQLSEMFKKRTGMSPKNFRLSLKA